ncbi:MAG: penicillin-binding protein 2 [Phycisphaerales bacterium]|nr:penicillin-binding protein 2 [Planctomycetota bacterium]
MQQQQTGRINAVATFAVTCITVVLVLLMARVVQLQIRPSPSLKKEMEPRVSVRQDLPLRGDILDRRGRILSTTRVGYRVVVDPTQLKQIDEAIVKIAKATGQSEERVGERILSRINENARRAELKQKLEPFSAAGGNLSALAAIRGAISSALGREEAGASVVATEDPDAPPRAIASAEISPEAPTPALKPIRYLPMTRLLSDPQVEAMRAAKVKGAILERVMVREYPGGPEVAPIVGLVGVGDAKSPSYGHTGVLGAEKMLNKQLVGSKGSISYVRDAKGKPLWIEPGQVRPAEPGQDVRLSVDVELQRIAVEELQRGITDADAAGGRLMIFDPLTGEVLAMVDIVRPVPDAKPYPWARVLPQTEEVAAPTGKNKKPAPKKQKVEDHGPPPPARYITIQRPEIANDIPGLHRNRCVEDIYEPGSTFKPFVWATITELGRSRIDEIYDTESGRWHTSYGRYIEDVTKRATMTWAEVLINSSNIGMIKGAERLTWKELHDAVIRFGFGQRTGIGFAGEASGIVTSMQAWSKFSQTSVAYGHEVAVTPLQMVRAFSAFCRPGDLAGTLPPVRLTAATADDVRGAVIQRVLPAKIADTTRDVMRGVAAKVEMNLATASHGGESGWKYSMFGKSGTAEIPLTPPPGKEFRRPKGTSGYFDDQYNSSFIAGGPAESPKVIVLCVIDDPGPSKIRARQHYGSYVAGPVVRRTMERALNYLGVQPSPTGATHGDLAGL